MNTTAKTGLLACALVLVPFLFLVLAFLHLAGLEETPRPRAPQGAAPAPSEDRPRVQRLDQIYNRVAEQAAQSTGPKRP